MTRFPRPFIYSLLLATLVLLQSSAALAQAANWGRGSDASDTYTIVLGIGAVVGIILLFAQVKLFSIDSSLKGILKELRKRDGTQPKE